MKAKKIAAAILLILFVLLLTAGGIGLYYVKTHYATVTLSAKKQTETTDLLNTPECGWYQLYAYRLEPDTPLDKWHLYLHEKDEDGVPYRLALLEFNLSSYKNRPLDQAAQKNIKNVLTLFQETKAKVILRFLYDWDGNGIENEPESLSLIKKHMKQTSHAINPFRNMIYTTQGIFVGSWGEMHTSRHLATEDMTELLLYYASVTDSSIYLAVRTPNQYRSIMEELEKHNEKYQKYHISREELTARLGLFNDGMLGSISDVGTYQEADNAATRDEGKQIRKKEIAFQTALCIQVPNGGEVVTDNSYNNWKNAIKDLRAMRVSYLNQIYDDAVIKKWKKSPYSGKDTLYHGMSAYDYISRHLGARLVLQDSTLNYQSYQQGPAHGTVTVKNVGFSNMYHEKTISIGLINKDTGKKTPLFSSTKKTEKLNPCHWSPGETITIPYQIAPFDFPAGNYALILSLSDAESKETILFANDSYDKNLGGYLLGNIKIEHG